uniref:Uncharacterized protein n=1 Tax=Arundo donax TaxID=35708 RepID=A0A0A9AZ68_ARUDO
MLTQVVLWSIFLKRAYLSLDCMHRR